MPVLCNESFLFSVVPSGRLHLFPVLLLVESRRGEAGIINRKVQLSNQWYSLWNISASCLWRIFPRPFRISDIKVHTPSFINQLLFGNSAHSRIVLLELHTASQLSLDFFDFFWAVGGINIRIFNFLNYIFIHSEPIYLISQGRKSFQQGQMSDL